MRRTSTSEWDTAYVNAMSALAKARTAHQRRAINPERADVEAEAAVLDIRESVLLIPYPELD